MDSGRRIELAVVWWLGWRVLSRGGSAVRDLLNIVSTIYKKKLTHVMILDILRAHTETKQPKATCT